MANVEIIIDGRGNTRPVTPRGYSDLEFTDRKIVPSSEQGVLDLMIQSVKIRREQEPGQSEATVKLETNLPWVGIFNTGDWHIGSEHTDYELWHKHMALVHETDGLFMNVVGDERDNFVIPKIFQGSFESVVSPQQQADFVETWLKRLDGDGKLLARAGGNHDNWTWMGSGVSLENYWYRQMKSPLFKNGGFLHLFANEVPYDFYLHHGLTIFNSNFNPNHATKRAFEFQGPYDCAAMGHSHVAEVAHGYRWNDRYQKDYVQMRTGTYKLDDPYARSKQLGRGQPAGATVLLSTETHRQMPFLRLEDAVMVLRALNKN